MAKDISVPKLVQLKDTIHTRKLAEQAKANLVLKAASRGHE
jgi:hypothetical protein